MDNTRRTLVGIILSALIAVLVGVVLQLAGNTERLGVESAESTRTTLDQTRVAVAATNDILPTPTIFTALPTAEVTPSNFNLLLTLANDWPLLVYEPFDDNLRGWTTGGNGIYSRGERNIEEGRYRWQLTAIEGFTWWTAPIDVPFDNFYASVTMDKQDHVSGDTSMVFRYNDGDNYYEFGLCDDVTQYRVYKETNATRTALVACTAHAAIHANASNRLSVLGQTDRYLLFINDQYITTIDDDDHKDGGLGIGLDMDEGQVNVFEFDDMVVRSADLEK